VLVKKKISSITLRLLSKVIMSRNKLVCFILSITSTIIYYLLARLGKCALRIVLLVALVG